MRENVTLLDGRAHRSHQQERLTGRRNIRVADYSRAAVNLWEDLQDLFDLINSGHRTYGVQAYNGGLFDVEAHSFLVEKQLPDWYLARIIDQLGRAPQPDRPADELYRVDYRDLAIQQLGSVYEGLLELKPRFASAEMRVVRSTDGKQERITPALEPVPRGFISTNLFYSRGSVYLATDKGERRRTGSYYTPDHIVDHIVQTTLGARCAEIHAALSAEITEYRAALERTRHSRPP